MTNHSMVLADHSAEQPQTSNRRPDDVVNRQIFERLNVRARLPEHTSIKEGTKSSEERYSPDTGLKEWYVLVDSKSYNDKRRRWEAMARGMASLLKRTHRGHEVEDFGIDAVDGTVIPSSFVDTEYYRADAAGILQTTIVESGRKPRRKHKTFRCQTPGCKSPCATEPADQIENVVPKCQRCGIDMVLSKRGRRMLDDNGNASVEPGVAIRVVSRPTDDRTVADALEAILVKYDGRPIVGTAKEITAICGDIFKKADLSRVLRRLGFEPKSIKVDGKSARRYSISLDELKCRIEQITGW